MNDRAIFENEDHARKTYFDIFGENDEIIQSSLVTSKDILNNAESEKFVRYAKEKNWIKKTELQYSKEKWMYASNYGTETEESMAAHEYIEKLEHEIDRLKKNNK